MRLVSLDSGPLGLLTNPLGRPKSDQCRQWVKDLAAAGVRRESLGQALSTGKDRGHEG